jgi:hypothetical protein
MNMIMIMMMMIFDDNNNNNNNILRLAEVRTSIPSDLVSHTDQSDERFRQVAQLHSAVNVVQTAAKCDTQHRSASCCSYEIT